MTITAISQKGLYLVEVEDEEFAEYTMEKYNWVYDSGAYGFNGYFDMVTEAMEDYNRFIYSEGVF